jgi:hypothetical protein
VREKTSCPNKRALSEQDDWSDRLLTRIGKFSLIYPYEKARIIVRLTATDQEIQEIQTWPHSSGQIDSSCSSGYDYVVVKKGLFLSVT